MYTKLILQYFFFILTASLLFLLISFHLFQKQAIEALSKDLKNNGVIFSQSILPEYRLENWTEIRMKIRELYRELGIRITVVTLDGNIVAESNKEIGEMDNHLNRAEIEQVLKGRYGKSLRYSETLGKRLLYVAVPILEQQEIVGFVRMGVFFENISDSVRYLLNQVIVMSLVLVLIALLFSHRISKRFLRPIETICEASKKVASGDFSVCLFHCDSDEIQVLVRNFNFMTRRLKELFAQVTSEKEEAESIIASVGEGIIVINRDGVIVNANDSFYRITGKEGIKVTGRYCWEILREKELLSLFEETCERKRNLTRELEIYGKIILCSSNFILSKEEKVLVFSDVTKLKQMENLKKDFVSNVSHELRTPLTAVKGFLETIVDGREGLAKTEAEEELIQYIEIISRHTERMIHIVNDLLTLSELENQKYRVRYSRVDLCKLISPVVKMFEEKINQKGLVFRTVLTSDQIWMKGDLFKLEQLFINLIDNAIKYTDQGSVTVKMRKMESWVEIEVEDTGIGISEKLLDRLFERFFVVDKSRSRKTGGTGLGLSIVKHIVLLHQGNVKVKSKLGKGTSFLIELPLSPSWSDLGKN